MKKAPEAEKLTTKLYVFTLIEKKKSRILKSFLLADLLVNPARYGSHTGKHNRNVLPAAASSVEDDPSLVPEPRTELTDQGTSLISLAGLCASSAHHAGLQLVLRA